jgi:hypothetical protein
MSQRRRIRSGFMPISTGPKRYRGQRTASDQKRECERKIIQNVPLSYSAWILVFGRTPLATLIVSPGFSDNSVIV